MGEVFKARDTRLNRLVAIKVLRGGLVSNVSRKERFMQETQYARCADTEAGNAVERGVAGGSNACSSRYRRAAVSIGVVSCGDVYGVRPRTETRRIAGSARVRARQLAKPPFHLCHGAPTFQQKFRVWEPLTNPVPAVASSPWRLGWTNCSMPRSSAIPRK